MSLLSVPAGESKVVGHVGKCIRLRHEMGAGMTSLPTMKRSSSPSLVSSMSMVGMASAEDERELVVKVQGVNQADRALVRQETSTPGTAKSQHPQADKRMKMRERCLCRWGCEGEAGRQGKAAGGVAAAVSLGSEAPGITRVYQSALENIQLIILTI